MHWFVFAVPVKCNYTAHVIIITQYLAIDAQGMLSMQFSAINDKLYKNLCNRLFVWNCFGSSVQVRRFFQRTGCSKQMKSMHALAHALAPSKSLKTLSIALQLRGNDSDSAQATLTHLVAYKTTTTDCGHCHFSTTKTQRLSPLIPPCIFRPTLPRGL